jgi:hypothetical protein
VAPTYGYLVTCVSPSSMMVLYGSGQAGRDSGNHGSEESCLIVVAEAAAMRRAKNFILYFIFIII